jgi:penicillin V acylase-like amidase (Ntn superfamily)
MTAAPGAARRRAAAPLLLLALALAAPRAARACTRVLYTGDNNTVITGRTLDWLDDTFPSLWAMPRGVARSGEAGPSSIQWTAKHGSLVVSMYDTATLDGVNEKGLVANGLYLVESDYGKLDGKPAMSIPLWAQYALDNFATVKEAVSALRAEPFRLVAPVWGRGRAARDTWRGRTQQGRDRATARPSRAARGA